MKRRILAALMCLCMLVGLLPTTALAANSKEDPANTVSVKFYYIYNNTIPDPPQTGNDSDQYGPSGNNEPFITVQINMEQLFQAVGQNMGDEAEKNARDKWWVDEGTWIGPFYKHNYQEHGYVTAESCQYYKEENGKKIIDYAGWWNLVVSCMDETGKSYFENNNFGKLFQGYAIKSVESDNWQYHCDGIVTENPPVYFAELFDGTKPVETLTATQPTGNTVKIIQERFTSYLRQTYGNGQVSWQGNYNGVLKTDSGTSYKISLTYVYGLNGDNLKYNIIVPGYNVATITMTVTECYTVTYDANDGTGSVPTDNNTYSAGDTVTVKFDPQPTKTGYTFLGWSTNKDATTAAYTNTGTKQFSIQTNTKLYAIWQAKAPGLAVEKTAALVNAGGGTTPLGDNGEVTVGDTIRYTVTVSNNGGPAENVQVSDTMFPSGGNGVTVTGATGAWNEKTYTITSLGVNSSVTFAYDYTVTSGDAATGSIQNTARVQYASEEPITDGVTVTVKDPETTVSKIAVSLSKDQLANYLIEWTTTTHQAPEYTPVSRDSNNDRTLTVGNASSVTLLYVVTLTAVDTDTVTVTDTDATYVGYQSVAGNTVEVTAVPGNNGTYTVKWANEGTPAKAYLYFTKTVTVSESLNKIENTVTVNGDKTDTSTVPVYQVKNVEKEVLTSVPQDVTAPDNLANFIQVNGQSTVLIPADADKVALLYQITVTGTEGAQFAVEDPDAKFWSGTDWNGTGAGTIDSTGKCTLYCYKTFDKGNGWGTSLSNTATVLGQTGTEETPVVVAQGEITITPVDMTAYMGGTSSYWEDMDGAYVPKNESGIPAPRFYVEIGSGNVASDIQFYGTDEEGTAQQWELQLYSDDVARYVWHIRGVDSTKDASCMYFEDEALTHHVTVDDEGVNKFNHLYATIQTEQSDSTGAGNTDLYAKDATGNYYTLTMGVGNLYIREVITDGATYAASTTAEDATKDGEQAGVVIPDGTTFTVNGKEGWTLDGENGNVSLLFDDVLEDVVDVNGVNLLEKAIADNAEKLGLTISDTTQYESKYLDLVDADDGNVWVKANNVLTVYWPYPAGITYETAQNYTFSLFHFTGMHREERVYIDASSMINQAVQNINGETYPVENNDVLSLTKENITLTENGIQFTVDQSKAGFSPFVLVYDTNVTVTFNGGEYGTIPTGATVSVAKNGTLQSGQIPSVTITDSNATFTGWKSSVDGKIYTNDELLDEQIGQDTTFTAQYDYDDHDQGGIQYDHHLYYHSNFGNDQQANEGTDDNEVVVQDYEDLKILPERDGYTFVNWNTEKNGSGDTYWPGDVFDLTDSEHHLYAQWQKDKTGPDDSGVSNWLETKEHRAYLSGYPDSTFRADRNMTRAEVAQMFYALLLDKDVTITKSFSDVPDDAWYATAVKTLASLGMMDGYPDGTFRPDEPITRAEFATVGLAFAYDPMDASCSYYDVSANAWYYTYVAQASTYGWIGGYPDNTFRPGNNITRVEVCVIVNNMLGRCADERYIDRHQDELVHFVDLSDSYWGYYTIMESTNTHDYTGSYYNETWKS